MTYFTSKHIAAITISAAFYGVLSAYIAPIFWNATHLPFFCDTLGVFAFILVLWWVRKFGAVTMTSIIATIITLTLNPSATQFFGFTAAGIVFDILTKLVGYKNSLDKRVLSTITLLFVSFVSTTTTGVIIGSLFMNSTFLTALFGGIAFFAMLHATGGVAGAIVGIVLTKTLSARIDLQKM
ncbi:hypothetical protein HXY32_00370 [Candidatus Bathyarchaeota archaeon]|nr:hypothetical protein [Candidatus Bathyarchaeota archaeon]